MIAFNKSKELVFIHGQSFTLAYFQAIQIPLLVDTLGWSVRFIVETCEREGIELGQAERLPAVRAFLMERYEQQEAARKEQAERDRLAVLNSPEAIAQRQRDHEEFCRKSQLHAANRLGTGNASQKATFSPDRLTVTL